MPKIILTDQQKAALESRHKKSQDARDCDRIKAVLLRSEGWTPSSIAQALRKSEFTICRHLDDYLKKEKLKPDNGGSESYLNDEQTRQLIEHISEHTYAHTHQIVAYISDRWDIKYTVSGLNKWLHQKGFTYKKPKGVPHKADADKQAEFVKHYDALKASLPEDEVLLFMDAVHPTQATKITSGWIRKGVDKIINTTGSRTRLNIVGAIELNNLSAAVFDQFKTVNGEAIIKFFRTVRASYASMTVIHIVLDGAGYHRSKEVVEEAEKLGIKLHYLPPYSLNLNPIERLWKVMNEYARNNEYFAKAKEFREKINHFLDVTLPEIGASLVSRINDSFQRLNPAS
ncbi:IS630 family transposase [Endozoicomonas montiporae CL-33]|uniref:IS630 family transposase n=1 Tax=Endozoicomonas montiporae CL-33 TaxID=570277 RepID=A0A142BCQ0_9GAMM|nr:IS630 family transposase [Endozoicomonas montiporae]AMO56526.1 IS630 family transposase [Endozoicomonas montiporae CL-33]